jgi:two-component system, OmpR family, response regulator RpaA
MVEVNAMEDGSRKMDMPKVLVVDDDPDMLAVCSLVLESEGYDISVARNGYEAYDRLTEQGADLMLIDVMMPVLDGLTVCKMVKRDPRTKDVPVIVMSASSRLCDQAESASADAVIPKPFDINHLVSTVNHFAPQHDLPSAAY